MYYDFDFFLNSIKYLDYQDAESIVETELKKVSTKGKKEEVKMFDNNLKGLRYWLKNGKRSPLLSKNSFLKLKPLCENYVSKKQLSRTALQQFQKI